MDEYGTCSLDDAKNIAFILNVNGTVTFSYCRDEITAYVINITYIDRLSVRGKMPYGGNPSGRYMVSIVYKGAFHFSLEKALFPDYVQEKLNLSQHDAASITELLNKLRDYILL